VTWDNALKLISKADFLQSLMCYDLSNVPNEVLEKLKPYMENPDFNHEKFKKISLAGSALYIFVKRVYTVAQHIHNQK
jgi:dynein heavy chain